MLKKSALSWLLALMAFILTPLIVLATVYSATFTVTSTTAYTHLPIMATSNNTYLAANGYLTSSGLDGIVKQGGSSLPTLIADNKTLFVSPNIAVGATTLQYTTGNTPVSSMPVITGYNGYVTVADNTTIEHGSSFVDTITGYVDTSAGYGKTIIDKPSAYKIYTASEMGAGQIGANVTVAMPASWNIISDGVPPQGGWYTTPSYLPHQWVNSIRFRAHKTYVSGNDVRLYEIQAYDEGTSSWVSPTGGTGSGWINVANAYDGNTATYANNNPAPGWTSNIELTFAATIETSAVRFWYTFTDGSWDREITEIYSYTTSITHIEAIGVSSGVHTIELGEMGSTTNYTQTLNNNTGALNDVVTLIAQTYDTSIGGRVTSQRVRLSKTGAPTGNFYVEVREHDAPYATIGVLGVMAANDLAVVDTWYTFSNPVYVVPARPVRITVEYYLGTALDTVQVRWQNTDPIAGHLSSYFGGAWAEYAGFDLAFDTEYDLALWISIDNVMENIVHGVAIPNNANNYTLFQNNVMPYVTSINMSVSGVQQLYFAPNAIINGTNLPDRGAGIANNGTITWGTNPVTVSALSSFIPSGSSAVSVVNVANPDVLPTVNVNPASTGTAPVNPLSPLVNTLATLWYVSALQAWFWIGIILTAAAFLAIAIMTHHVGFATMASCLVIGVFSVLAVFPIGALFIAIIGLIGGVILEAKA